MLEAGAKTAAANAAVTGIGPTRRILLTDTLLGDESAASDGSIAEMRAVLGHELGHHRPATSGASQLSERSRRSSRSASQRGWSIACPTRSHMAALRTLAGIAALGLCLGLAGAPSSVLLAAYSRRRERAADAFGFDVAGDPEAFARALERLCRSNLAELEPPRFLHPPAGLASDARPSESRVRVARHGRRTSSRARMAVP